MTALLNRRLWPALILAVCLGLLLPPAAPGAQETADSRPPAPRRSSIILIVAQGIGCGDLSCYGSTTTKTPNLDRLAKEGARFTSFYSASTADSVARAALMLGYNTGHLNLHDDSSDMKLGTKDVTFSQLLESSGYRTTLSGVWGFGNGAAGLPQKRGFGQFVGFLDNAKPVDDYPEFVHRFQPANVLGEAFDGRVQLYKNAGGKHDQHVVEVLTDVAMNAARINKPEFYNQYQPFFVMLSYPLPQSAAESRTDRDKFVTRMDEGIGLLLDRLEALKIETNTIVMFTSTGHGAGHTSNTNMLSDADLRVPMIVRWPARLNPVTVSEPWAAWDIFPTMMAIARKDSPANIDGISFYPMLKGQSQTNHHDFLYWESRDHGFQQAARTGYWKAIRLSSGEKPALYDLNTDPEEKKDVADEHPEVVEKFEKYFKSLRAESEKSSTRQSEKNSDHAVKQNSAS